MFLSVRVLIVILLLSAIYVEQNIKRKDQSSIVFIVLLCWYTLHNIFDIIIYLYSDQDLLYISYGTPFLIVYSPLIYFYYTTGDSRLSLRQIVPHAILPAFWGLLYLPFLIDQAFRELIGHIYYIVLYASVGVSLLGYTLYLLIIKKVSLHNRLGIMSLYMCCAFFSLFVFIEIVTDYENEMQTELSRVLTSIFPLGASMILFNKSLKHFKDYTLIKKNWGMFTSTLNHNKRISPSSQSRPLTTYVKKENSLDEFFNSSHILKPELDIKDAARVLNITQKHLSDLIRENHHTTFFKMLTAKRIEMACKFILDESLPNAETLYIHCGFKSKATFYRNFLFFKGCTPSQYKVRHSVVINNK